jgi:phage-related protein
MALNLPVMLAQAKEADAIFMVELYVLYLKTGNLYFCAADQDIVYKGQNYLAIPLERDKYTASSESTVDACTLRVSNFDDSFTSALYSGTDFRGCLCDIFQIKYPEALQDTSLIKPIMRGYLDAPILKQKGATFEVQVKSQVPNLSNARTFQLSCNSTYADQESCFANKDVQSGICQAGTTQGTIVIERAMSDKYWNNGIIRCRYESRMIESSQDNVISLHYPFSFVPTDYTIERGCDKSWASCQDHGQQTYYSGFIAIPNELIIRSM